MALLRAAVADAPFVFVVGKGGVGKTTTAAALALELVDDSLPVHLISTDPAHSLRDVLGADVPALLIIDEFNASTYAAVWLDHARGALTEIIEHGTYLDRDDVAAFTRLALPGIDELMAAMRLVDLAGSARVVVDTAPTGHTMRLLDAANTHEGVARALRAMADKAAVVASSFAGRAVRLRAETLIDELETYARRYGHDVLQPARFVMAARTGTLVEAETQRLRAALRERRLHTAATVWTGDAARASFDGACFVAPLVDDRPRGTAALRAWSAALQPCARAVRHAPTAPSSNAVPPGTPALPWLEQHALRFWLVAGKGGVGKTTCAAALAVAFADKQDVLLCSADPAGSLSDALATETARLRTRQIEPEAEFARLRDMYRDHVLAALDSMGLSAAAALDRRVIESLWELAPPGVDEMAALVAMLDIAESQETVILDTAPTGHFLRLLGMPSLARDWAHQLMRMLLKYGAAGTEGGAAEALLRLTRELRALHELLHDPQRSGVLLVTLAEPVVQAETERLHAELRAQDLPVVATIVNRAHSTTLTFERTIHAPELEPAPVGAAALREFAATWNIVV